MPYIPKNKIITSLYATPEDGFFLKNTLRTYVGYYYKTYDGLYFSGETPNDPTTTELTIQNPNEEGLGNPYWYEDDPILAGAEIALKSNSSGYLVPYSLTIPTSQDYSNGEFTRYFSVKRNQPIFTEISAQTYNKIQQKHTDVPWQLVKVFTLTWTINGESQEVFNLNKNMTNLVEQKENVPGLGVYLNQNWLQHYETTPVGSDNGKYSAILVAGLDYGSYKPLDEQVKLLQETYLDTIKGFRYNANISDILDTLKNNPYANVFLFSAGCRKAYDIAKSGLVDLNSIYIIEPYAVNGNSAVTDAIKLGVPPTHLFVGDSKDTGKGLNPAARLTRHPPFNATSHWDALRKAGGYVLY